MGMQKDPDDGVFVVEVALHWLDHLELVQGENVTLSVEAIYGPSGTWHGSMDYIINFDRPEFRQDDDAPQFALTLGPSQSSFLRAGGIAVYYLSVLTPPNSAGTYWLDVASTNNSLSVCRSHMVSAGRNLPCFETERPVQYLSYEEDGHRDRAVLDIGPVKNIGTKPLSDADDNNMVAQVVVKLEDVAVPPDNFTEPEVQEFEVTVKAGDTELYTVPKQVHVDVRPAFTNFTEIPVVKFTKLNAEPLVTIGGGVVYNLDFFVPYGSISDYQVRFFGDRVDPYRTTVCEARLIQSGWNVPCVNGTFLTTIYNSTNNDDHIDTAFIDVGTVANMNPHGSVVASELNKVRVQVVVQLENNDTVMENDQLWLGAVLKLNEHNEYYLRASFNATQDSIYSETSPQPIFQIYQPRDNVVMTIGSRETYYLKITTPVMSTPMTVNITMPTAGDEAFLTVSDMQLVRVGVNYACHHLYELEPVYNSTHSTSQNDTAFVDLGIITNHGTTHYYQYNPEYAIQEDDEILISFEVQLADHPDLSDGAEVVFDIAFDYSLGRQTAFSETVGVSILGDERPEVEFNITMPEYDPMVTQQGDLLLTEFSIYHTNYSTSHAYGVVIYLMLPYYLEIDPDVEIEGPPLCVKTSDAGVKFHFAEMFFTDTFTLWFNISMDPNRYLPIDMNFVNTTIPLEIVYYKRDGTDGDGNIVLGEVFKTETLILDLSFRTEQCFDVLGIESSYAIRDCQITASSYLNETYSPQMARLNSESGWAPAIRDMKPYQGNDYLEIRFGGLHRFSGVRMQKGFNDSSCVMSYQLSYSVDGIVWFDYDQTFINNYNETLNDSSSLNLIPTPFNGEYFRIRPQSHAVNTTYPVMRFELYGCRRTPDIDLNAACAKTKFPDYPYYERGFLIEPMTGAVYVCILEYIDGPTRCSYSLDNGTTWEAMDNNVANVIGLEPETKELFGISQNRLAIMRSGNLGVTWSSMEPERYQELSNSSQLLETMKVPFTEISDEPDYVMATDGGSIFFEWGAASEGLFRREVMITYNGTASSDWELMGTWGYP
ncbi:uncharacterized protein LOC110987161 [Acanthaster planci]|uniref:Uncharacterized protein LOC110987161 n=1 Tax=Acanthaster planci TaxID=133434 RepID=A0A8B7ZJX5_ACAPL|nr:uncharacterized protein LOC110987161 [Acanthaster planci]